jgi:hypothetical protein
MAAARANYVDDGPELRVAKWRHVKGNKKCGSEGFCAGMGDMLQDGAHMGTQQLKSSNGADAAPNRITAVGDDKPEAIGLLWAAKQILTMFNFCPACGGKLKLPENRNW